jgi:hypothetical protein
VASAAFLASGLAPPALCDPRALAHALYVLTPRLAVGSRAVRNARLVVVGGGDAALGALEAVFASAAEEGSRFPHLTSRSMRFPTSTRSTTIRR